MVNYKKIFIASFLCLFIQNSSMSADLNFLDNNVRHLIDEIRLAQYQRGECCPLGPPDFFLPYGIGETVQNVFPAAPKKNSFLDFNGTSVLFMKLGSDIQGYYTLNSNRTIVTGNALFELIGLGLPSDFEATLLARGYNLNTHLPAPSLSMPKNVKISFYEKREQGILRRLVIARYQIDIDGTTNSLLLAEMNYIDSLDAKFLALLEEWLDENVPNFFLGD